MFSQFKTVTPCSVTTEFGKEITLSSLLIVFVAVLWTHSNTSMLLCWGFIELVIALQVGSHESIIREAETLSSACWPHCF